MNTYNSQQTLAALSFGLVLLLSGCEKETATERPPLDIDVTLPVVDTITEWSVYTGRLEAVESVDIRARISGYLESVNFKEGQMVNKGDLLFVIDPRPFQADVSLAEAHVAQAEAAQKLADANRGRAQELIDSNAISREQLDVRNSEAQQAQADVMAAQAELDTAKLDLEYTEIRAPISGIAGQYGLTPGNLVQGGNAQSTLLTTIIPHDPIYVYFDVDERSFLKSLRRVMAGELPGRADKAQMPMEIQLSDETEFSHKGVIDFSDNQLNSGTATIRIRGILENPDDFLTPGLFARVRTPAAPEAERLLVPDRAVLTDQELKYVWVVGPDNIAQRRTLDVGPLHGNLRVVRSGLTAEDRVAVTGVQFLQPGMLVTPRKPVTENE